MQLVEYFETDAVARFTGGGVRDAHGGGGFGEFREVAREDELVGYLGWN